MLEAARYKSVATRCGLSAEEYVRRIENGLKRCSRCKQWLPVKDFIRNRSAKDGLGCYCRPCGCAQVKEYYGNNLDKMREFNRQQMRKHRSTPEAKRHHYRWKQRYRQTPKGRLYEIKRGAIGKKLAFELTVEHYTEHLFAGPCHWCGGETEGGVDRVDNAVGYLPDNCVSCCKMCNVLKRAYDADEWLDHLAAIVARHRRMT